MPQIFTVAMQKGGVGKTTTALSLGVEVANLGRKVLLVDLDPQGNLSQGLGIELSRVDNDESIYSVYEVLLNPSEGIDFATIATDHGPSLVPATLNLSGAELELAGRVGRELLLRKALDASELPYDLVLIDTPPSLGLFTLNALAAANHLIVPMQLHAYALGAMDQLLTAVDLIKELNRSLTIGGMLCTFADRRTNLTDVMEKEVRETYGELVFETVVPSNVKLAESPLSAQPITEYAPKSTGAIAYRKLAKEFIARFDL